jgi:hypothetical protein
MAKKKYSQSRKDRMDERRGMDRYEGKYRQTRHDRMDERRGMEHPHMTSHHHAHGYHQTRGDRMDERRGMEEYYDMHRKHSPYERHRTTRMHERAMQERDGYDLIREDHTQPANLPQRLVLKKFPECNYGSNYHPDDTMASMDRQMRMDEDDLHRFHSKVKY